jgi:hypothetical protein
MPVAPALPTLLSIKTQQALCEFQLQCYGQYNQNWDIRNQMREIDRAYQREADFTAEQAAAKRANRTGDKTKFQNITIPIVLPQVEASTTYQSSVFLTGIPLFGVAASPAYEDEAMQMETLIDNQATRGGWVRELTMFFRDGAKYNISALEVSWEREVTFSPETDLSITSGKAGGKAKETIWEGNTVKRWDMYNTFFDTRVAPAELYKRGEFVGRTELLSRIALKQFIATLPEARVDNLRAAFESNGAAPATTGGTSGMMNYYIPQINPRAMINPIAGGGFNWAAWAELSGANNERPIAYNNMYDLTTMYVRILPSDFAIKGSGYNTPQVWKLIFVNHKVLIYAERQTNAHGYLPVLMGQPNEDGLNLQTKSLAENVLPIQDITSALSNSNMAARRRAISDRTLYDPSRITEANINNVNPSAKIPVRPAAYGKPLNEAVYPFPFRDDQFQFVDAQIKSYSAMANMISGQNPVRQGQFVKGNKTQSEFDSVMNNANGRDQLTAIGYEAQVFTPLKEMLKINNLQYQGGVSLFNRNKQQMVDIDPVALRKAVMEFKISDGIAPTDKLMDVESNMVALQTISSSPQIGAAYNIAPLFSYFMKLRGAHIKEFEKSPEQQAYESAQAQYNQMILQIFKQSPEVNPATLPKAPLPQDYGYNPAAASGNDASLTSNAQAKAPNAANQNPISAAMQKTTGA